MDSDGVWNVTDAEIEEHGLQAIINCTMAGDTISLQTMETIRPAARILISHRLTIEGIGSGSGNTSMRNHRAS
ncbi:MAG: hypothetical protein MI924_02330, partial [Chloroflexales bacterium]|nr:hypothetical protein [Chloroflexales bacterium]